MPAPKPIHFDEHKDRIIRNAYQSGANCSGLVKQAAQRLGISSTSIHRRACVLGVVRFSKKTQIYWTDQETEILEKFSHQTPNWIIEKLIKAGFKRRTEHSILQKLKVLGITQRQARVDAGIYTLCELSRLSGITTRSLASYIQKGWLKAEKRNDVTQIEYIIKAADLRKFIIDYTANIDILRFDKFWLVDVLTQTIR
jgi:hypothetical protein